MSFHRRLFGSALALLLLLIPALVVRAQSFGVGVSATPNPVVVSNYITYSILVTNQSGLNLTDVFVTNSVSADVIYNNDGTNTIAGDVDVISGGVLFSMPVFNNGAVAQLTLKLAPKQVGSFTNEITVATFGVVITNVTTNVVTTVTPPVADLAIGLTNVALGVFTNDTTVIGLFVTNLGPNTATGIVVSNQLPPSFNLVGVTPANANTNFSGGVLTWNISSLASGVRTQLLVTVRPTNSGPFSLSASVTGNVNDTNAANNSVTNAMQIASFLPSLLSVAVITQQMNPQTGLLEMLARVSNNATTNVPAVRLIVSDLPTNTWLYNAAGSNSSGAYVSYNATLPGNGATVDFLLEYYVLRRAPLTNYTLTPLALDFIPAPAPTTNGIPITDFAMLPDGFVLEFPTVVGKAYTIIYADNLSFTNALAAQPAIVAPATRVRWIDSGPPKTIIHPNQTGSRFYRVQESP